MTRIYKQGPHRDVIPTRERFEQKIEKTKSCWLWRGHIASNGYGSFAMYREDPAPAHRASYRLYKGDIPQNYTIDHLCRVRACVNPDHLEAVTQTENNRRAGKLKLDAVLEIRSLKGLAKYATIAEQFNISESMVSRIMTGSRWNLG